MKRETTLIRALVVTAGLLPLSVMVSCDRGGELSAAIGKARNTLTALTGSGASAAPTELRDRKYADVIRELQEKIGSGDPGSVAAANLLMAQATAGQAELIAARARAADGALASALVTARAEFSLFREQRSLAAAREGYNPLADIAKLEAQAKERTDEIAGLTSELAKNEEKVKALRDRAAAETAKADAKRAEERSILSGSAEMISSDRLDAAKRAAEVRRAGDGFERAAAELEAEMRRHEPRSEEIRLEIRRAQQQKDSLAKARQSLLDLQRFTQEQVKASLESAAAAEAKLAQSVAAIEKMIAEEVKPRFDEALTKYNAANSKVGAARNGGSRQAVAVTGGTVQHAIAGLQREKFQSLARAAAFMAELGAATPALSDAAKFTQSGAALLEESKQAMTASAEAYASASGAFQGAGSEPYTRLAEQLTATEKMLKGEPPEAPPAEGDEAPAEGAPAEPAPQGEATPAPEQPAAEPTPAADPQQN